jgi:hypothetical protein
MIVKIERKKIRINRNILVRVTDKMHKIRPRRGQPRKSNKAFDH